MSTWLLIHPPLLGPAVLAPLAAELRARGREVRVPDLRGTVTVAQGWFDRWTAAAGGPADVVVGFSGAGVVLPAVAAAAGASVVVWLDALMPARAGETVPDGQIRTMVAGLAAGPDAGGWLPEWTTWWGAEAWAELVPDAPLRAAIEAEGHRLPADFYDIAVPVPASWPEAGARYVQLSAAYDSDAAEARARGWPVGGGRDGTHLDVATQPARVADLLLGG